jgi:hypothetical protein
LRSWKRHATIVVKQLKKASFVERDLGGEGHLAKRGFGKGRVENGILLVGQLLLHDGLKLVGQRYTHIGNLFNGQVKGALQVFVGRCTRIALQRFPGAGVNFLKQKVFGVFLPLAQTF